MRVAEARVARLEKLPFETLPPFALAVELWIRDASDFVMGVLDVPFEDISLSI